MNKQELKDLEKEYDGLKKLLRRDIENNREVSITNISKYNRMSDKLDRYYEGEE